MFVLEEAEGSKMNWAMYSTQMTMAIMANNEILTRKLLAYNVSNHLLALAELIRPLPNNAMSRTVSLSLLAF